MTWIIVKNPTKSTFPGTQTHTRTCLSQAAFAVTVSSHLAVRNSIYPTRVQGRNLKWHNTSSVKCGHLNKKQDKGFKH